jgi:NADH-quinone oxidoreductase subunit J
LAITLVLVYVGAVMVLFLFVVMMLDIDFAAMRDGFKRYLLVGSVVAAVLVFEISAIVMKGFYKPLDALPAAAASVGQTKALGLAMFQQYAFAVEVASVILLVAIIAAVALTMRKRKDVRYNDPQAAIRTQAKDRMRIIKMDSVKPPASAAVERNHDLNLGSLFGARCHAVCIVDCRHFYEPSQCHCALDGH